MDGVDAFAVSSSPWSSLVRGLFSPATLFLLLNVVIGTIAFTSRSHSRDDDDGHQGHQRCHGQLQHAPPAPPLERTSSVMERLRSLGLYRFRSGDFPPEYNHHLSAAADGAAGHQRSAQPQQDQYTRSLSEPAARPPIVGKNSKKEEETVVRRAAKKSASVSEVKKLERAPAQAAKVQRAPPRAPSRAVVAARARGEADAAAVSVDARADDFINRFRQQLQLQRLNSLLNCKEMLNRGM